MDYFRKWIEVGPIATITFDKVHKFIWKCIICHFGTPHTIITNNDTQFASLMVKTFCA